jgi:hypothetical protein
MKEVREYAEWLFWERVCQREGTPLQRPTGRNMPSLLPGIVTRPMWLLEEEVEWSNR